jgi:hypothetical protein
MSFVMASSILGALRDSAEVLFLVGSEPLWLVLWGSGLLVTGAAIRSLLAPNRRFHINEGEAHLNRIAEHRSLSESRA